MCSYYPRRGSRSTRSAGADTAPAESASLTGAEFRRAVRAATVDARIAREAQVGHEEAPPPPSQPAEPQRPWIDFPDSRNAGRYDGWNGPTRAHLANGRAGGLTPAQQHRARHAERV
ncbi:hypothetical protein [Plantactinospora sp. DSM 117369]